MRNVSVVDNLPYTQVTGIGKDGSFRCRSDFTVLEQFEIVLFAVREINCQNLSVFLVDNELRLNRVPLLLARIVMFLAVFTVFCLFFSVALSDSRTHRRG